MIVPNIFIIHYRLTLKLIHLMNEFKIKLKKKMFNWISINKEKVNSVISLYLKCTIKMPLLFQMSARLHNWGRLTKQNSSEQVILTKVALIYTLYVHTVPHVSNHIITKIRQKQNYKIKIKFKTIITNLMSDSFAVRLITMIIQWYIDDYHVQFVVFFNCIANMCFVKIQTELNTAFDDI